MLPVLSSCAKHVHVAGPAPPAHGFQLSRGWCAGSSSCDLLSVSLRLIAEAGEISGTPTAEEPVEVDSVIQGIDNSSAAHCNVQQQVLVGALCQDSPFLLFVLDIRHL